MKRTVPTFFLLILLLVACAPAGSGGEVASGQDGPEVIVYRAPT